jgi:hypothetical protein
MNIEPGKIRAPGIRRVCINSAPLGQRMLRGKVVLIDSFTYTCVIRLCTLPYPGAAPAITRESPAA